MRQHQTRIDSDRFWDAWHHLEIWGRGIPLSRGRPFLTAQAEPRPIDTNQQIQQAVTINHIINHESFFEVRNKELGVPKILLLQTIVFSHVFPKNPISNNPFVGMTLEFPNFGTPHLISLSFTNLNRPAELFFVMICLWN